MPIYDVNQARLVFGNPLNGIIQAAGFNSEWNASDFDSLFSLPAATGRHAATEKVNLFWEKNSNSIILRPDLSLKSMGGASPNFTDGDGKAVTTSGGSWELVTMPGQPELKLLHQKNVTAKLWQLKDVPAGSFSKNQGFVFYWTKYSTPAGSDSYTQISLGGIGAYNVTIVFYPREKTWIHYTSILTGGGAGLESFSKEIPVSFLNADGEINTLSCFFAGEFIIIGINGIENTVAIKPNKTGSDVDANGITYPIFTQDSSGITIISSGSGVFGFKRLSYATSGSLSTPMTYPCYVMTTAPSKEIKSIQPVGTTVTMETFAGGNDPTGEDVVGSGTGREAIEKFGVYANVRLTGDGTATPILRRFGMSGAPSRATMSGSALEVNGNIRSYEENWQGDQNGDFLGGDISALIRCKGVIGQYKNIYQTKAGLVRSYLTLANNTSEVFRMVSCLDTKEIKRPRFGTFDLQVDCQDITKRLRGEQNIVPEIYDGRGWTDVDLMTHLGKKSGVKIRCAPVSADKTVPASYHLLNDSGDDKNPNWQFGRGATYWEFMSRVRAFSGWILSPDTDSSNRDGLYFRPKPTDDDTPDWTFNADTAIIEDVGYKSTDLWKTRFSICGIAAADNQTYTNKSWNYKKGDFLCGVARNESLEAEIGESRERTIIDPTFTNWEGIGRYLLALYDYYTTPHEAPVFRINNFEAYQTMQLYQQIAWTDTEAEISGKYLITALRVQGDKFRATASVNTIVTATGLIEGIMKEEKRRQEKGMLDSNITVRSSEAISQGDYIQLMQKAPNAIRMFAFDSDSEHYRSET